MRNAFIGRYYFMTPIPRRMNKSEAAARRSAARRIDANNEGRKKRREKKREKNECESVEALSNFTKL